MAEGRCHAQNPDKALRTDWRSEARHRAIRPVHVKMPKPYRSRAAMLAALSILGGPCARAAQPEPVAVSGGYLGTENNKGRCETSYQVVGYAPADGGRHPLFLYFVGTNISGNATEAEDYRSAAPLRVAKAMAQRGYTAYSVQYDNRLATLFSDRKGLMRCLFDKTASGGLIEQLCARDGRVDCDQGIATWGHSLGGAVAIAAKNSEPRVRAAWVTGVSGVKGADNAAPVLPRSRIRIVNGAKDAVPLIGWLIGNNNDGRRLSRELELTPARDCPGQQNQCLRADGSGWIIVQADELSPRRPPDHCWFYAMSCSQRSSFEEANFIGGDARISINANADWLVKAAAMP